MISVEKKNSQKKNDPIDMIPLNLLMSFDDNHLNTERKKKKQTKQTYKTYIKKKNSNCLFQLCVKHYQNHE